MKALVTGGTGLIGSHLIERLLKEGISVRALVRKTSDTSFLKSLPGVEFAYGDVTDPPAKLRPLCEGVDYVAHCAALVDDWADRETMYKANVASIENIAAACDKKSLKFLVMGSMAVLGMGRQENLDETAPYIYSGDNYNFTKIEAEKLCLNLAREKGLPVVVIRPPYVYGPRDRQLFPRVVKNLLQGKFRYIGDGRNPFEIVYVGNLVEAMWLALRSEKSSGQIYMVTDGKPITRRALIETMCEVLGIPAPQKQAPLLLAKLLCPLFESISKLTGLRWRPPINRFIWKFIHTPMTFDISKARRELGYNPPFEPKHSLRLSIEWYKRERLSPE